MGVPGKKQILLKSQPSIFLKKLFLRYFEHTEPSQNFNLWVICFPAAIPPRNSFSLDKVVINPTEFLFRFFSVCIKESPGLLIGIQDALYHIHVVAAIRLPVVRALNLFSRCYVLNLPWVVDLN